MRAGGEHGSGGADLPHQLCFRVRFLPRLPRHGSERKGSTEMVAGAFGSVKTVACHSLFRLAQTSSTANANYTARVGVCQGKDAKFEGESSEGERVWWE